MKKIFLITAVLSMTSLQAFADDLYGAIAFGVGKSSPKISGANTSLGSSTPIVGEIAAGTYFTPHVRGELALSMYEATAKTSGQGTTAKQTGFGGMLNVYYDFTPANKFVPYVVGGVGYMSNKVKFSGPNVVPITSTTKNKSTGSFGYQIGAGIDFNLDMFKVGLGYRFRSTGSSKSTSSSYKAVNGSALQVTPGNMNMLLLGARCDF